MAAVKMVAWSMFSAVLSMPSSHALILQMNTSHTAAHDSAEPPNTTKFESDARMQFNQEGSIPTDRRTDVQQAFRRMWHRLPMVRRHGLHPTGGLDALVIDGFGWSLFCGSVAVFVTAHGVRAKRVPDKKGNSNSIVFLLLWGALALLCFALVYWRYGGWRASVWLDGYLLEFVFMLDNVLVLQMISSKFRLPWETTYMALVVLVLFQLLRSMIFYLVLASNLKSLEWLQYLLGVSLLYAAYQAVSGACEEEFDIMETQPMQLIKHCLGDRLVALPAKDEQTGVVDLAVMRTNGKGQVCLTMGGLMLACLLIADFVLNIDVALTKMEELQDRYMCLSSSALAAFTLPDVFPLIEGIFKRFPGLKYAVGFVFVFVGVQMLLYRVVTIPALLGVAIMVAVLLLGIASSVFLGWRAGGGTFASPPPA